MKIEFIGDTPKEIDFAKFNDHTKIINDFLVKQNALPSSRSNETVFIIFKNANEVQKINFEFRGKNKPTDILSFEAIEENSLGELLFCNEVLIEQAKKHNHSTYEEFLYLFIHGTLHLLGFDHEINESDAQEMFKIQDQLFELLVQK